MSIRDVYLLVFQPCQREVGRLWEAGRITVAQEHYCTAATQVIMSQLAPRLVTGERITVEDEDKVIGILLKGLRIRKS